MKSFNPPQQLVDLAERFADNYKTLQVGEYCSDDDEFHIKYLSKIKDSSGRQTKCGARVSHNTGIIELDKSVLKNKKYSSDFVYFVILWLYVIYNNNGNFILADKLAINHYLTTKRLHKNLAVSINVFLKNFPSELNKKRLKEVNKIILKKEKSC